MHVHVHVLCVSGTLVDGGGESGCVSHVQPTIYTNPYHAYYTYHTQHAHHLYDGYISYHITQSLACEHHCRLVYVPEVSRQEKFIKTTKDLNAFKKIVREACDEYLLSSGNAYMAG